MTKTRSNLILFAGIGAWLGHVMHKKHPTSFIFGAAIGVAAWKYVLNDGDYYTPIIPQNLIGKGATQATGQIFR